MTGQFIRGNANPNISTSLNELISTTPVYLHYDIRNLISNAVGIHKRMPLGNGYGVVGQKGISFKDDFYERIHISPARVELGTVASEQTRQLSVWNAYTLQNANLTGTTVNNGGGLLLNGPATPRAMTPLQELFWTLRVTPDGQPAINANILFDFSNVPDPLPVFVTGTRASLLPVVPEIPVVERWRWLTDMHVSVDGTEQRVGLRAIPRRSLSTKLVFVDVLELKEHYRILLSSVGRLFIPYYQYATTLSAEALAGTSTLEFDTGLADLRDADYVVIISEDQAQLIQLGAIGTNSAATSTPLINAIPKGAVIAATFASFIPNNSSMQRAAVNNYGTATVNSDASFPRSSFQRPGSTATLTKLDGMNVLDRRPLANADIGHTFDTGQASGDASTGLIDLYTYWDFTKVEQELEFNVRRVGGSGRNCGGGNGTAEFDYWRKFLDEARGSLNTFLMSSFRPDQTLFAALAPGSDSAIFFGASYIDNFWPAEAYRYVSFATARGFHYAKVTSATKGEDGNSRINFSPPLPPADGWNDITQVSYLLKLRIADDEVTLEHMPIETTFKIQVRTAA